MEEIIQAIATEAKRHRAQAKLADLGGFHERQAELLERGAEFIRQRSKRGFISWVRAARELSSFKESINEPRRTEE